MFTDAAFITRDHANLSQPYEAFGGAPKSLPLPPPSICSPLEPGLRASPGLASPSDPYDSFKGLMELCGRFLGTQ